jgi:hypothetical protein
MPLDEIVTKSVVHFRAHGVAGGYTHLGGSARE